MPFPPAARTGASFAGTRSLGETTLHSRQFHHGSRMIQAQNQAGLQVIYTRSTWRSIVEETPPTRLPRRSTSAIRRTESGQTHRETVRYRSLDREYSK